VARVTFLRIVTPSAFAFLPLDGSAPVWSRRVAPEWLADELEREALASGPAARPTPSSSLRGAAPEATPVSLRDFLRIRRSGRG
jgi:hypothetical protein